MWLAPTSCTSLGSRSYSIAQGKIAQSSPISQAKQIFSLEKTIDFAFHVPISARHKFFLPRRRRRISCPAEILITEHVGKKWGRKKWQKIFPPWSRRRRNADCFFPLFFFFPLLFPSSVSLCRLRRVRRRKEGKRRKAKMEIFFRNALSFPESRGKKRRERRRETLLSGWRRRFHFLFRSAASICGKSRPQGLS